MAKSEPMKNASRGEKTSVTQKLQLICRLQVLDAAFEAGSTHWDTADAYGDSEDLLGKWYTLCHLVLLAPESYFIGSSVLANATPSFSLRNSVSALLMAAFVEIPTTSSNSSKDLSRDSELIMLICITFIGV